jgi:hypothetical protein
MAALQGMSYAEMLLAILQTAERRLGLAPAVEVAEALAPVRSDVPAAVRR